MDGQKMNKLGVYVTGYWGRRLIFAILGANYSGFECQNELSTLTI